MDVIFTAIIATAAFAPACSSTGTRAAPDDPPEVVLGERLFRDPRFAQWAAAHLGADVDAPFPGDPVLATLDAPAGPRPSPFAGQATSCRSCHLVDDAAAADPLAVRAYTDFARRSPLSARDDGETRTPRNSPTLVGATAGALLHFDGEFATAEDLVAGGFLGRNFGWLPSERAAAIANLARVVRGDGGALAIAEDTDHLPYRTLFARLAPPLALDVEAASDDEIVAAVSRVVAAYLRSLDFARDDRGCHAGAPYDRFLAANALPCRPDDGETVEAYAGRLAAALAATAAPIFVDDPAGFAHHDHPFAFGARELAGLRVFLDPARGACVACHAPPDFTDLRMHDAGATQLAYDDAFGDGAFAALHVPDLDERRADPARWLPPAGPFRRAVDPTAPGAVDLGAWNVVLDAAHPAPQAALRAALGDPPDDDALLAAALAAFKTPTLRDLGQSPPYLHDGRADTVADAIRSHARAAALARAGRLRNPDPALAAIRLTDDDLDAVAAFLAALDEDYE